MKIIHVVRRFGPVGGMERYVYEIVLVQRMMGYDVEVVCEEIFCDVSQSIVVHEIKRSRSRPRWFALFRFSQRVSHWLDSNPRPGWIVHSHERLSVHHITTFHGQPFATIFERSWLRLLSLRVAMHLFLERRELSTPEIVVPNSELTRDQLLTHYPQFKDQIAKPILPGTSRNMARPHRLVDESAGVIAFVGTEWRRKGLAFAAKIVEQLRKKRPSLTFVVIGPNPGAVAHLFSNWDGGYQLLGWVDQPSYSHFDALLHPAKIEPYGMVVTEALSANLQVVISDRCGVAADVVSENGSVLSLNMPIEDWVDALEIALKKTKTKAAEVRSWQTAALEYQSIYAEFVQSHKRDGFSKRSKPALSPAQPCRKT